MKVAIIGAGSIGNHLAFSARKRNWQVSVFDHDLEALRRFEKEIFPSRYGGFDQEISLKSADQLRLSGAGEFDVILIGTPPDTHLQILREVVPLKPKAVFIEKPFCPPNELEIFESREIIRSQPAINFFCGYNHRLSLVTRNLVESISAFDTSVRDLNVDWLESWNGILMAHPWIRGPGDTYLGSTSRGGGALFEHSHGLDLWIQIALFLGLGVPSEIKAEMKVVKDDLSNINYDESVDIEIVTEKGFRGRVTQNVLTQPSQKRVSVTCSSNSFLAEYGSHGRDRLTCTPHSGKLGGYSLEVVKPRPSDFDLEIAFIEKYLNKTKLLGPDLNIDAESGLYTAFVASQAIRSSITQRTVNFDSKGWELAVDAKI